MLHSLSNSACASFVLSFVSCNFHYSCIFMKHSHPILFIFTSIQYPVDVMLNDCLLSLFVIQSLLVFSIVFIQLFLAVMLYNNLRQQCVPVIIVEMYRGYEREIVAAITFQHSFPLSLIVIISFIKLSDSSLFQPNSSSSILKLCY